MIIQFRVTEHVTTEPLRKMYFIELYTSSFYSSVLTTTGIEKGSGLEKVVYNSQWQINLKLNREHSHSTGKKLKVHLVVTPVYEFYLPFNRIVWSTL